MSCHWEFGKIFKNRLEANTQKHPAKKKKNKKEKKTALKNFEKFSSIF